MHLCIEMFPFGGGGFGLALGPFEANYRCYPVTFIDKPEAETGDKIFLPPSALDRLCETHPLAPRPAVMSGCTP